MSQKTKRYLMLIAAVGVLAVAAGGAGTFASFNAETANNGNYFATGTLFLHTTKSGGTTCKSEINANNANITANGCDVLFNTIHLGVNQTTTVNLKLENAGSVNASQLAFALGQACANGVPTLAQPTSPVPSGATTSIAVSALPQAVLKGTQLTISEGINSENLIVNADAASGATTLDVTGTTLTNSYTTAANIKITATFGSANLCSNLQFTIQEMDTNWSTNQKCIYPTAGGTTCSFSPSSTISGITTTLNDLTPDLWTGSPSATNAIGAGKTRWIQIGVKSPSTFTNAWQHS